MHGPQCSLSIYRLIRLQDEQLYQIAIVVVVVFSNGISNGMDIDYKVHNKIQIGCNIIRMWYVSLECTHSLDFSALTLENIIATALISSCTCFLLCISILFLISIFNMLLIEWQLNCCCCCCGLLKQPIIICKRINISSKEIYYLARMHIMHIQHPTSNISIHEVIELHGNKFINRLHSMWLDRARNAPGMMGLEMKLHKKMMGNARNLSTAE